MTERLPKARVGRNRGGVLLLRAVVVAIALGASAWLAGARVTLGISAMLGMVLGTRWGLHWWIARAERPAEALHLPDGDLIYPLRPGFDIWALTLTSAIVAVGAFAIGFATGKPQANAVGIVALLIAVPFITVLCVSVPLRQRIRVTEWDLELPRSQWSKEVITVGLEDLDVSVNENVSMLWLHFNGTERGYGTAWLGHGAWRELCAVLKRRTAVAAAKACAAKARFDPGG